MQSPGISLWYLEAEKESCLKLGRAAIYQCPQYQARGTILSFPLSQLVQPCQRGTLYPTGEGAEASEGKWDLTPLPLRKPPALLWVSLDLHQLISKGGRLPEGIGSSMFHCHRIHLLLQSHNPCSFLLPTPPTPCTGFPALAGGQLSDDARSCWCSVSGVCFMAFDACSTNLVGL